MRLEHAGKVPLGSMYTTLKLYDGIVDSLTHVCVWVSSTSIGRHDDLGRIRKCVKLN